MSESALEYLKGELVRVCTEVHVQSIDEEGNPVSGAQAFVGWLIDYDADWLVLGEYGELKDPYVNALVRRSDVTSVEIKLSIDDEALPNSKEDVTLN